MRPEEKVEKDFVKEAERMGWRADKYEVRGKKGRFDRIVYLGNGIIVFIEFKKPGGGIVSAHQREEERFLKRTGYNCLICDNVLEAWDFCMEVKRGK